jgi:hypothetical protein
MTGFVMLGLGLLGLIRPDQLFRFYTAVYRVFTKDPMEPNSAALVFFRLLGAAMAAFGLYIIVSGA